MRFVPFPMAFKLLAFIRLPVRKDTNFPPETPFWCTSTPSQNAKKERTDRLKRLPLLLPLLVLANVEDDVVKVAR